MQISAIVVTYNEERRLRDCLQSLKNIQDVIVVDIGSTDHSKKIAQQMDFKVINHAWVPIGEMVLPNVMPLMQNDWIIRVDPDEVLPHALLEDILKLEVPQTIGIIQVPYQYYFLNKKLNTTIWGGMRPIPRIINRIRVNVTSDVHRTLNCKSGYDVFTLPARPENAVLHYWVDSYHQLISKHERYLEMEGQSRYNNGLRYHWKSFFLQPLRSFASSFLKYSGWRGGWAGWFLSFFIAFYEARALYSLKNYEKEMLKDIPHK